LLFVNVNPEHFAALTLRSQVKFLRHRPIWTLRSVSSRRCRRSSRHEKLRNERKRFIDNY